MSFQWDGAQLEEKRKQAIAAFQSAMGDAMLSHQEWVQMTELLWQLMSEKLHDAQLDVLRNERFSTNKMTIKGAVDRVDRFSRHQRVLRALNFLFKCYEVDWGVFLQTVVELVEGRIDVTRFDRPPGRDKQHGAHATTGKETDDSRSG